MDKIDIFEGAPSGLAWSALNAAAKKEWAVKLIRKMLAAVHSEGREPDAWEASELAYAITCVSCGYFSAAATSVDLALTPLDERSPYGVVRDQVPHDALLIALEHAEAVPVRDGSF